MVPPLLAMQFPMFVEYKTVLLPIAAIEGLRTPKLLIAPFVVQVPPPGEAVNASVDAVLHIGKGIANVGV
jgi:hypothetical protein